ncbi:HNH endonuclease [Mesorhizobium sp. B2-3-4]|nr:HNH endonuclease [Mesorhizobium sp. B2-3-4]
MAWLAANHALPISEYHAAFTASFPREDVRPKNLHALRKRMGWKTGRTGCFVKGHAPLNKGKSCPPGKGGNHPNARATQFRTGHGRSGIAVDLYKPVGTERLSKDGYREVKIHDGMPLQSRWRGVHLVEWERLNGPVPKGCALKCLDGNRKNTDPSNWEAVPRGLLPRLNGKSRRDYDHAPAELRPTIMAIAKLEHRAARAGRRREAAE